MWPSRWCCWRTDSSQFGDIPPTGPVEPDRYKGSSGLVYPPNSLRVPNEIGGASGAFLDQAGRRGLAQPVLVARARRTVAIQRRVPGTHPGVPIFLLGALRVLW